MWESSPWVIKAMSLLMHSPLFSIPFYHTESSFLAPHTFFFHSMPFSHRLSTLFMAFLNFTLVTSDSIIFFTPFSHRPKPSQYTLLCSTNQLFCNINSFSQLLFPHFINGYFSIHILQTPQLHYIYSKKINKL